MNIEVEDHLTENARWVGLAGLVTFAVVGLVARQPADPVISVPAGMMVVGAGTLLAWLRARRGPALAVLLTLATLGVAALTGGKSSNIGWFALCILAAWSVLADGRIGAAYWTAGVALLGAEWLWGTADPGWGAWIAGVTFSAGAAALGARERMLVTQLRAAQAGVAERSRAEERGRIARELHDVIAHCLAVSLLHISSARLAVQHDPADAARSLAEAERLGRESLNEVRSIMGLLRADQDSATAPPVPGAGSIVELVARMRAAGAEIDLALNVELERLPATTGATVYRILQEALTNATKHAPGAAVTVSLEDRDAHVELIVDTAGAPMEGHGMGVDTMRERAAVLGGSCQAGPSRDGWRVRASLPTTPTRQRAASPRSAVPGPRPEALGR